MPKPLVPTGVRLEGGGAPLPADAVLLALGPWTGQAPRWLPRPGLLPGVGGQKAHSVVLRPNGAGVDATAVFTSYRDAGGKVREPEIYPRPDGTVYVSGARGGEASGGGCGREGTGPSLRAGLTRAGSACFLGPAWGCKLTQPRLSPPRPTPCRQVCGESSMTPVPDDPASVGPDSAAATERIVEAAAAFSGRLAGADVAAAQACYLPITDDGLPLIGRCGSGVAWGRGAAAAGRWGP
jgi:glycine/D-amino acid oxidase-like deaminating enzyme